MKPQIRMAVATSLGGFALIGGIGLTVSSAWLITMAAQHPPILVLSVSIVMVRFFGISRSVARYAERIVSHETIFRKLTALRVQLFEKVSSRTSLLVRDLNSGNYVKSIVDDVERAQEYQLRVILPRTAAFISLSFALLLALWIFPAILVVLLPVTIALLIVLPSIASKLCSEQSALIEESESRYSQEISNALFGATEARIYGYSNRIASKLKACESEIAQQEKKLLASIRILQFATMINLEIAIVGVSLLVFNIHTSQELPAVKISMAVFLPLVAFEGITNWYPNLFVSGKLLRAQQQVSALISQEVAKNVSHSSTPLDSSLRLRDVRVSWDVPFMTPVSTEVNPGELLVIRGKSGSGKSTLSLALTGLLPYEGSIQFGGCELSELNDLHHFLTGSLQRGHIFNTSLRENLKIANPEALDEELLRITNLLELDAISLDDAIGEFGRPLSGGEIKRIGVARALLSPAKVVILDEPTEHLDRELALRCEERIADECRDKSLIVITHSGWAKSTRTVVIERE
ncbi:MAG: thiol reductant exporter subunit CydC [Actinomycetota bacterium]|jgi:thiol reductant ABC exporter CydC subunit